MHQEAMKTYLFVKLPKIQKLNSTKVTPRNLDLDYQCQEIHKFWGTRRNLSFQKSCSFSTTWFSTRLSIGQTARALSNLCLLCSLKDGEIHKRWFSKKFCAEFFSTGAFLDRTSIPGGTKGPNRDGVLGRTTKDSDVKSTVFLRPTRRQKHQEQKDIDVERIPE